MAQIRVPQELQKIRISMSLHPDVVRQLDAYRGDFSRSLVVEGIVAGYLELVSEEGITKFEPVRE